MVEAIGKTGEWGGEGIGLLLKILGGCRTGGKMEDRR